MFITNNNPLSKDNYTPRSSSCSNPGDVTHQLIAGRRSSPFIDAESGSSPSSYASSMDNISKLLDGFMKSTTPPQNDVVDIKPLLSATEISHPLLSFDEHVSAAGGEAATDLRRRAATAASDDGTTKAAAAAAAAGTGAAVVDREVAAGRGRRAGRRSDGSV
ncbi:hypothetical protein PR202_ga04147 [Eleusine coracana subsp. coracana]|uniref:Uncharacterized protein n=1 Tax=Eleusine coracana subsp. coracana TaxID=191504 RepID=A0AAV5BQX0_ELECO|nr:hypothetical protein PR202_ga04147 [Eleusine coracana subsp. coracana]